MKLGEKRDEFALSFIDAQNRHLMIHKMPAALLYICRLKRNWMPEVCMA